MEKKIIELATEKGFTSSIIGKSVEAKYSNKDFYYLWMCELQKWLREVHKIHIAILPKILPNNEIKYYSFRGKIKKDWTELFNTYEEALEEALKQVLILIKEKNEKEINNSKSITSISSLF